MFHAASISGLFASLLLSIISGGSISSAAPGDVDPGFEIVPDIARSALVTTPDGGFMAIRGKPEKYGHQGIPDVGFSGSDTLFSAILAAGSDGGCVVAGRRFLYGDLVSGAFAFDRTGKQTERFFGPLTGEPTAFAVQADGKVLLGWSNSSKTSHQLKRYLSDGTEDPTFSAAVDGECKAITIRGDGGYLIGGKFTTVSGQPRSKAVMLHPDGALNPAFVADCTGGDVEWIFERQDGKIILGGSFASVNNTPTGNMAVVNAAGALDPTFSLQDGVIIGTGHAVLQADGKVICNARNPYYGLLRIDTSGQVDPTLSRSYGSSEVLFTLDPTGKIVVAGTIFNEPFSERLLNDAGSEVLVPEGGGWKWQRSGSVAAVNQVVFDCFDGVAWSAPVNGTKTSDGWIYSGPVPGRGVLRARGTTIQSKHAGTAQQLVNLGASEGDLVVSLKNGEKVASGLGNNVPFPTVLENHTRDMQFRVSNEGDGILDGIALEISGANASAFRIIGDPARQLAPGDSTVFVIRFNGVGEGETQAEFSITSNDPHKPEHTFVIIGKVGTTLTPTFYSADDVSLVINRFDGSTLYFGSLSLKYPPLPGTVLTVVDSGNTPVQPFSDLPPGSVVTANYDGVTYSFLAGYNGSDNGTDIILSLIGDGTFDQAWGDNGLVGSGPSAVRSGDGQLVVWSNLGGQTKLVRFRVDGTLDPLFNPPPIDIPSPMVIQPDGKVLIGKNRLNWNGSIDQSYVPPQGIVQPLAMLDDGRILVECETASMGSPRILRRLFQDGSIDPTFVDGLPVSGSYTDGVELLPDGKMLVFGSSIQLTRLFPDGSVDPTFQSEASAEFVSVQTDGKILVAKRYTGNTKEDSRNFVRLLEDGSVDASSYPKATAKDPISMAV
jgi:uncharacterized delta-60 repeat protein